jgi:hypothetical protein
LPLWSPVSRASSNSGRNRWSLAAARNARASLAVRGSAGLWGAGADVAGDGAKDLLLADGVLQGGLEYGVHIGQGQRREPFGAALARGAAAGLVAGGVEAASTALARGAELVVAPSPWARLRREAGLLLGVVSRRLSVRGGCGCSR